MCQPNPIFSILEKRGAAMQIKIILEPSKEGGYTAIVPSLPGCISEGDSKEEALRNVREAIELYLEPVEDDQVFTQSSEIVELAV
jgi:predicted RNase H-like HicB family nuclease